MAGEKILVVDDQAEILTLLEDSLRLSGYHVVCARNGQEALAKVYQEQPALIILDIMMPGISGYEVCRILKNQADTKHIPIIFLTARGQDEDIRRGFEMRADGYVVKPFEPRELADFAGRFLHGVH